MKHRAEAVQGHVEVLGVLARHIPTRLIEISRSGCLLESGHRIDEGTVAALHLDVKGSVYSEDVRATRCVAIAGSGSRYLVGVEFLGMERPDGTSIRYAMSSTLRDVASGTPGFWAR